MRRRAILLVSTLGVLALGLAVACLGCKKTPTFTTEVSGSDPTGTESGPPLFEDVTAKAGSNHFYRNGEEVEPPHLSILESLGGGLP